MMGMALAAAPSSPCLLSPLSIWKSSRGVKPIELGFLKFNFKCKAQAGDPQQPPQAQQPPQEAQQPPQPQEAQPPHPSVVYQGVYGPWTIEPHDIREVFLYRSGLLTAVASFLVPASTAFLPHDSSLSQLLLPNLDFFFFTGATGLGFSLYFIHIYISQIKFTLQSLWAFALFGSLLTYTSLARPTGLGLVHYVVINPSALWLVGPLFAALTGLVFKEGLCYGKLEAAILTFVIPTLLLGHLTGLMDHGVKLSLLAVWMALFVVFGARKFTQPVKDDIGDKSVFMFNSLTEEEKAALRDKLQQ